jgi:hypothetical protein
MLREFEMDFRYDGFHQLSNIREFIFRLEERGADPKMISVLADMSLFAKYHLAVQDGPLLCLRKLSAELPTTPDVFCLTDDDIRNFAETHVSRVHHKKRITK